MTDSLQKLDNMLSQTAPWLRGEGQESDIVISTRVRLARNLASFPFLRRATEQDRRAVCEIVHKAAKDVLPKSSYYFVEIEDLDTLDREYLHERQLISRDMLEGEEARAVLIDKKERFCVMVNEEDHLRLHAMTSGLEPRKVWTKIDEVDNLLESVLTYATHEKYGYLTACPTNVGTGLRVSVMLHLPALAISKEIEKVFRSVQKINLAVRGLYGEGSQALGDFYQISNQVTLGMTELDLVEKIENIIPDIVQYEREARRFLLEKRHEILEDRCNRAMGLLMTARTIGSVEAMHHLSSLRLGVTLGLLEVPDIATINDLFLNTLPAHLQKRNNGRMEQAERDIVRAKSLREKLG